MTRSVKGNLVAVYYIETKRNLREVAEFLVELETTGKWQGSERPTPLFESCRGSVAEVREIEPVRPQQLHKGTVTLLYPLKNMNLKESAFASIWLYMIGGATHALIDYEKSRLVDFALPDEVLKEFFPGPAFGLEGTRELLSTPEGQPIIGTIVKPTAGLTPEEVAKMCYEFALGGLKFIKDDEKMMNPDYCPLARRVRLVSEAIRRAEDKTGEKVLYAAHISTGPENLLRFAELKSFPRPPPSKSGCPATDQQPASSAERSPSPAASTDVPGQPLARHIPFASDSRCAS